MCYKGYFKYLLVALLLFTAVAAVNAQNTIVTGFVTDAANKQPLSYVTVSFPGTTTGINTDSKGRYTLSTSNRSYTKLQVSFVGYKTSIIDITPGKEQTVNVKLQPDNTELDAVLIRRGKKKKYSNNDNPAVELIRKVIANKEKNRPEAYNYVEYKGYERLNFSFINVSENFSDKKFFRKYKFLLDNRDTTTVPGKNLLPVYLNEKVYQYYYSKNPERKKTTVLGEKGVNFGSFLDSEGIGVYFKHLYQNVDIYANSTVLVTNEFLSPISDAAPSSYKFFITDTIVVDNNKVVELSFTPRNTNDQLFEGSIYITLDGNYAVQKADLTINRKINLNWVKSMHIMLDFARNTDGRYYLSRSNTMADFGMSKNKKGGLFGQRLAIFNNYVTNVPRPDTTYQGTQEITSDAVKHRSDDFWAQQRQDTLTGPQSKVYANIDSLGRMKSFRRTVDIASLFLFGYKQFGPFDLGPANAFYSFNPVEGFRLRVGGRTNVEFSKRVLLEGYTAYGFKDQRWKYFLSGTFSLNNSSIFRFPQHYIKVGFQRDTRIPGQELLFLREDNFLLSFKRGNNDKYLYNDNYRIDYLKEFPNHFSIGVGLRKWTQEPAGSLYFDNSINGLANRVHDLTTSEATLTLRYAPHEEFYQGKVYRKSFINKYPIITLNYTKGFKNVFGGEYNYSDVSLNIYKHVFMKKLGEADIWIDGGNTFGQVPYPLLTIHRANQTFAYDPISYNLMNFLEFVSDHYASINVDQHFKGLLFNRIPLLKKLKWREVASVKSLWGGIRDENNPDLHPSLYEFPKESNGAPITYALGSKPYVEGSVGIENIFKVLRVDLVRRFNYLDHANIADWGIRTRIQFIF
ncbi:DUF5686 and carboxypeptidase-like regulatory domain-containing protein [uncultured Mucilaginibacter sp.]|uniref:DUF5686 and carboxypeptidase-like regulatory domain-containing protein n=1 Tax=uncultured Mucilaginibacter sp. TaxID=797541 RepID=UPI002601528F|nr:DUF5686 and carboxypeptidase-like regulatory domain-containing protein [uncultured Mucilaginibacter sp.]